MIKVAVFTGGKDVPSARFRIRQYKPILKRNYDIKLDEFSAKFGSYPPENRLIRPIWGVSTVIERIPSIIKSYKYDVTFIQREMISTFKTLEAFTKNPRIFDVDDAIWVYKNGNFVNKIAEICDSVICGNNFLANYFDKWNRNIKVLPTAVDTERFVPLENKSNKNKLIIGWTGGSNAFKYLYDIEEALASVLNENDNYKLRIVSNIMPKFTLIKKEKVGFLKWSPENEVTSIQEMNVGIMPLRDTVWERGKCSYKMLLYMSCGIPVVVSPYGMNNEVLSLGECGFGAAKNEEWTCILKYLLNNSLIEKRLGQNGRSIVENNYSLKVLSSKLSGIIRASSNL